ncbi:hypothetical protein Q0N51_25165 [Priestia megaterium]|uniref:hypothetical protein n=1 Tax=Priestia megaterium TaxID=1404 RepID=UPI00345A5385
MTKTFSGFSVEKTTIEEFNKHVPRGYRFRKIREYLKEMATNTIIKPRNAKNVAIYPIRLSQADNAKINDIIHFNSQKGFKLSGSDIITFIIGEINEHQIRVRDTMNTSFIIDESVYLDLIKALKGSTINLSFEEYVLNDYKDPNIEYILTHKPVKKKTMPMLLDKAVIKKLDDIKGKIATETGRNIPRSNLFRDVISQMIVHLNNSDEEITQLQNRILDDFESLNSIGGHEAIKEIIDNIKHSYSLKS